MEPTPPQPGSHLIPTPYSSPYPNNGGPSRRGSGVYGPPPQFQGFFGPVMHQQQQQPFTTPPREQQLYHQQPNQFNVQQQQLQQHGSPSFPRRRRDSGGFEGISATNLYIKGLKNTCTDEDLFEMCKLYGTIHSSKAILDLTTHECKGFGFVRYGKPEEALYALNELTGLGYNVSFAKETFNTRLKTLQDEDSTNVYVSNLPLEMDEDGMFELFAPHSIVSTKILRDPVTQQSRGVGFARMESRPAAQAIISEFNGRILPGGQSLQVRFADSSAQKRFKQSQPQKGSPAYGTRGWSGYVGVDQFGNPVGDGGYLAYYDTQVSGIYPGFGGPDSTGPGSGPGGQ
ncbi:RNA-binding domain-containing protein [Rhizoclosmatium globosum]|uniref:RNA-binding domain-containing protein n=1 Tax=Rhizoclosmatium globosum TaxID=329046 RepID=A0A1Y2CRW0_9FUNG|nr:hypothetical protein HDU99_000029 [Rhizoclosmatium hyalinum]KAJ3285433.1 hypothetical protein HDU79_007333 [Rhizoclosmatium sp. JEL0117]ORY49584.1 RNA-binding domain-containing protein [Rhizoclosmatium globosum]|eukprot:ORY49584.1 RNA-binding domain-containing protein [Rhizoclosmatium globosum]